MDARKLSVIVGIAAIASAAIPFLSIGSAGAAAGHHANTRVTIQSWPDGLFGVVKSLKARDCAKRRHVTLFKKKGAHRDPSRDKRVGSDVARRNNGFYQWMVQTGETGPLYAKAGRTQGCERGFSKTYNVRPRAGVSQCTSSAPADVCIIGPVRMTSRSACGLSSGYCGGRADGPDEWGSGRDAIFNWTRSDSGWDYDVDYDARNSTDARDAAILRGHWVFSDSGQIDAMYVITAQATTASDAWVGYTPNLFGVPPGKQGGPLSFKAERLPSGGTAISFSGYLYKRR